jgi:hypothetical protein
MTGRTNGYSQLFFSASLSRAFCIDGHGTEPNEQNTQQSPGHGRNKAPHPLQS